VILNFKPIRGSLCPKSRRRDSRGADVEAFSFGFEDEAVTAVFRRFYFGEVGNLDTSC
jgi:hypothetical protein